MIRLTHRDARAIVQKLDIDAQVRARLIVYIDSNSTCEGWDLRTVARVADQADRTSIGAECRVATLRDDVQALTTRVLILEDVLREALQ